MREPRRILLVRLTALGDVLLATPAARALARRFPAARIDWLVEKPYVPLLEANPWVRPLAYDKRGRHAGAAGLLRLAFELEAEGYDLVIDLQAKPKTALLRSAGAASITMRKRTPVETFLSLIGREKPQQRMHATAMYLDALAPLGVEPDGNQLELVLTDAMRKEAGSLPGGERTVALAPGARWDTKRWPPEHFAALGRALIDRGCRLVLVGGRDEAALLDGLKAAIGADVPDTRQLSVGGLAAAIGKSALLVSNDSGPAHIASALGVPLVALFGPTSAKRWGPLGPRAKVASLQLDCSPCSNFGTRHCPLGHHACMRKLEPEQVLAEVTALLADEPRVAG